ncbi:MAG: prevent-host-death protein [Candidatus Saccharibacteria bacterium]|nr:prevent-host-death protein [Candidatus Saccharibacteria bacterium]
MTIQELVKLRLQSQHISGVDFKTPHDVARHMGAMQAQDYNGALWAIGLRTKDATLKDVEQAILNREIVRTWPMRGTLHFVAAEDIRWMLKLTAPRQIAAQAGRRRNLELPDDEIQKAKGVLESVLSKHAYLSRHDLLEFLEKSGIKTAGQRGIHILLYWAQSGLICFGPHIGKQPSFALLENWVPKVKELSREESLAELTKRYFTSHGPATLKDYMWWSSLIAKDAKEGLELAKKDLTKEVIEDKTYYFSSALKTSPKPATYLLPGFDEYMLGYTDRSAILHTDHAQKVVPGNNGMFLSTVVINGQIAGLWKKVPRAKSINIQLIPFTSFTSAQKQQIETAAKRYSDFIGTPVTIA